MSENKPEKKLCLVIGDPIEHSLSPLLHNTGYRELGIDNEFFYEKRRVPATELGEAISRFKAERIRGISVTIPHKVEIIKYLDEISLVAREIGAVNTVVNFDGRFLGTNTDYLGILNPLKAATYLHGKRVAIIGAGGATRAAVYALRPEAKEVCIFNRTIQRAEEIATHFKVHAAPLTDLKRIRDFDIIINCSALGLHQGEPSILPRECFHKGQVALDVIFNQHDTAFLRFAREAGAKTIHGTEMFFEQGFEQFRLYTSQNPPVAAMKMAVLKHLGFKL